MRRRRGIGWGGWVAIARLVLFALGLLQTAAAFDAMTVDQPGQWMPVYIALAVVAVLAIGLPFDGGSPVSAPWLRG